MALPISGVPVLTGEAAERFVRISEYNSENLSSSQYDEGREEWVKSILVKARERKME